MRSGARAKAAKRPNLKISLLPSRKRRPYLFEQNDSRFFGSILLPPSLYSSRQLLSFAISIEPSLLGSTSARSRWRRLKSSRRPYGQVFLPSLLDLLMLWCSLSAETTCVSLSRPLPAGHPELQDDHHGSAARAEAQQSASSCAT